MAKKMSRTVVRRHSFFSNLAGPVVLIIRWKSWRSLMFWPPYRKKHGKKGISVWCLRLRRKVRGRLLSSDGRKIDRNPQDFHLRPRKKHRRAHPHPDREIQGPGVIDYHSVILLCLSLQEGLSIPVSIRFPTDWPSYFQLSLLFLSLL